MLLCVIITKITFYLNKQNEKQKMYITILVLTITKENTLHIKVLYLYKINK